MSLRAPFETDGDSGEFTRKYRCRSGPRNEKRHVYEEDTLTSRLRSPRRPTARQAILSALRPVAIPGRTTQSPGEGSKCASNYSNLMAAIASMTR